MLSALKRAVLSAVDRTGYEIRKKERVERFPVVINPNRGDISPSIVANAKRNLARSIAEMERSSLPSLGTTWRPQAETIRAAIDQLTDPIDVLHFAQGRIAFDHRVTKEAAHPSELYDALVKREFPWFSEELDGMSENPFQIETSNSTYRGRRTSNVLFYHARIMLAAWTYLPPVSRVTEIGSGYGALARLWVSSRKAPASSYVLVDLPESLFFAEVALRIEFEDDVGYFDGRDPGTKIVLVPPHLLSSFARPSDLVVNSGSMQEMTDEWIDFYMGWLDRYDARYFYSLNYAAQPLSFLGESRNLWSPRPSPAWSTRRLNFNVPLMRAETPRDFLEAVYEKTPATGSLADWSHLRGHSMSREVYIEGLDLLRQQLNTKDAMAFLKTVDQLPYPPKEALWIAKWLIDNGVSDAAPIRDRLSSIEQGHIAPNVG